MSKPRSGTSQSDPPVDLESSWEDTVRRVERPGTLIAGRFRVERRLGAGGMGSVVLARHLELDQLVAIKMLLPATSQDRAAAVRLLREARAAARIKSDHVVRVFDVTATGEFSPYIVMEYLEGESVGRRVQRAGALSVAETADIVIQAAEAIAEAHALGIVHRDLKPENLFITSKPGHPRFVKVLDFGISKSQAGLGEQLTQSHALLASPAYAAPEQLRSSRTAGPAADIWSLGVILYECATGTRPFLGDTLAEICTQVLYEPVVAPRVVRAELPPEFDAVIMRCLEKEPGRRFASIEELVVALAPFAPESAKAFVAHTAPARAEGTHGPVGAGGGKGNSTVTAIETRLGDVPRARSLRQAGLAAAGLVFGAAVLTVWVRRSNAPQVASAAAPLVASRAPALPSTLPVASSATPSELHDAATSPSAGATASSSAAPNAQRVPNPHSPSVAPKPPKRKNNQPAIKTGSTNESWVETR